MSQAVCKEIVWNIINCNGDKSNKDMVKIKTQNDKIVETEIWVYGIIHLKKQLLESGRNSAM